MLATSARTLHNTGRPISRIIEAGPAVRRLLLLVHRGERKLGCALLHIHMAGLVRRLLSEGRRHAGGSLPGLALVVEVREVRRLATASSCAA